eukprot:SAG22_NODE_17355_length_306_cov_0.884058_1_plen_53_part_01
MALSRQHWPRRTRAVPSRVFHRRSTADTRVAGHMLVFCAQYRIARRIKRHIPH